MNDHDDGTDPGLAGLSPEFQKMIGGMAGHTATFQKLLERRSAQMSKDAAKKKDDEVYLESYADIDIHEDMLKDGPRVESYRKAIEAQAPNWSKSGTARVVDVGSGTGLLAVLCARAGAQKVEAVEASRLAHFLQQVVEANTKPGAVQVHECRAEDLDLGEGKTVDCIVSEWMGYFLLFENMLPSVLAVRDKYLKPGGLMLPSKCRLMLAPLQDGAWREGKIGFWNSVAGIDMSALVPLARATACRKPQHRLVPADGLLGTGLTLLDLDLHTCKEGDLAQFSARLDFDLKAGSRLDGFATWFECDFGEAGMLLSTAPDQPPTHWRQTAFYLQQPLEAGGGVSVGGLVKVSRHEEFSRGYRVDFELVTPGRSKREESFELR